MVIGIDIDDTTVFTIEYMLKYADIFEEERTGRQMKCDKPGLFKSRYYLKAIYGWDDETESKFLNKYYKNVLEECTMLPNANKVIQRLKDEGNIIHFITARLMNIDGCDTEKITRESLANFGIPYDSLHLHVNDKITFFKENDIDLCIEDSYKTCKESVDNGIKAILMTTKLNEQVNAGEITRVNNWDEIYSEIQKIKKKI